MQNSPAWWPRVRNSIDSPTGRAPRSLTEPRTGRRPGRTGPRSRATPARRIRRRRDRSRVAPVARTRLPRSPQWRPRDGPLDRGLSSRLTHPCALTTPSIERGGKASTPFVGKARRQRPPVDTGSGRRQCGHGRFRITKEASSGGRWRRVRPSCLRCPPEWHGTTARQLPGAVPDPLAPSRRISEGPRSWFDSDPDGSPASTSPRNCRAGFRVRVLTGSMGAANLPTETKDAVRAVPPPAPPAPAAPPAAAKA
jgi:hypothetical protein